MSFKGIEKPNTTQTPNIYLDQFLAQLGGNEFKVLMYIVRRTFGFHKDSDNISLKQMQSGIQKKNGDFLDHGTGLSKPTLLRALRDLELKGLITSERRADGRNGSMPTNYRLIYCSKTLLAEPESQPQDTPPGLNSVTPPGKDSLPPRVKEFDSPVVKNCYPPVVKECYPQKKDIQKKDLSIPPTPTFEYGYMANDFSERGRRLREFMLTYAAGVVSEIFAPLVLSQKHQAEIASILEGEKPHDFTDSQWEILLKHTFRKTLQKAQHRRQTEGPEGEVKKPLGWGVVKWREEIVEGIDHVRDKRRERAELEPSEPERKIDLHWVIRPRHSDFRGSPEMQGWEQCYADELTDEKREADKQAEKAWETKMAEARKIRQAEAEVLRQEQDKKRRRRRQ